MPFLRSPAWAVLAPLSALASLAAQGPITGTLVRDLETLPPQVFNSSSPTRVGAAGGRVWFAATSPDHGAELWWTDGSRAGTQRLADLVAGPGSSWPAPVAELPNGTVLLGAHSDTWGNELFAVSLAAPAPRLVLDINPTGSATLSGGVVWNGEAWFFASDGAHGRELWRSDGTAAGTRLADDLDPGSGTALLGSENLVVAAGKLWFRTTLNGMRLWVKDSPSTLARPVITLTGSTTGFLNAAEVPGGIVFEHEDPGGGSEPWFSDGTAANTAILVDLEPSRAGSRPRLLASDGQRAWFQAWTATTGTELWTTDGTPAGTRMVVDLVPGSAGGLLNVTYGVLEPGGDFLFMGQDGVHGLELWRSDGTAVGTRLVADIAVGPNNSLPGKLHVFANQLLFSAWTGGTGRELWRYDMGAGTVQRVTDIWSGSGDSDPWVLDVTSNGFLMNAADAISGREPWTTAGVPGTSRKVLEIHPDPVSRGSDPDQFFVHRDLLFFRANVGGLGFEPWVSDGTASGTFALGDLHTGAAGSNPVPLGSTAAGYVFQAVTRQTGKELWLSDGTVAGTRLLHHIDNGYAPQGIGRATAFHGALYFAADDRTGAALWRTDGTVGGTHPVIRFATRQSLGFQAVTDSWMIGVGFTTALGNEPWVSDGTAAGTRLLLDIVPGSDPSLPQGFTPLGDRVVFTATDPVLGWEPWVTAGTAATTVPLADLQPGPDGSSPRDLVRIGDLVVFTAHTAATGRELWRTDGTPAGTGLITELAPGAQDLYLQSLTAAGDVAFFWAGTPAAGYALWKTDGTAAGTGIVRAQKPSGARFTPTAMASVGDGELVVFAQDSATLGREVWVSDGTTAGTRVLTDVNPGVLDASPYLVLAADGVARAATRILFSADDGNTGRELHALSIGEIGAWVARPFGSGCGAEIGARGAPVLGAALSIDVDTAAGAPVALLTGPRPAFVALGPDCTLHVASPATIAAATADAQGRAAFGVTVPAVPALVGGRLQFQSFALVPGGPLLGALAGTPGLEVIVGR